MHPDGALQKAVCPLIYCCLVFLFWETHFAIGPKILCGCNQKNTAFVCSYCRVANHIAGSSVDKWFERVWKKRKEWGRVTELYFPSLRRKQGPFLALYRRGSHRLANRWDPPKCIPPVILRKCKQSVKVCVCCAHRCVVSVSRVHRPSRQHASSSSSRPQDSIPPAATRSNRALCRYECHTLT